ncbi:MULTISPECIES: TonB-dependent receptor [unclassified Sphingobacterium]|uniref:TonB-dependent receptor n=1 Tax=unclassified Sphingobacterium TaxID=2609468 RepID=UPI002600A972|nr:MULTISPECIES: TonB-dependent receptor [unclassified Sphingobacterium]
MKRNYLLATLCLCGKLYAQTTDSTNNRLEQVEIKAYFNKQPLLKLTSSAAVLSQQRLQSQQSPALVSIMNTVPGLRMEERSPGSYRLALRGSMLRSPFGIRNVKIYLDDFPLTDAGGNTYLNLIDPYTIDQINILKGPDGSIYGANAGGVISLYSKGYNTLTKPEVNLQLTGGSYGLFQQQLSTVLPINQTQQLAVNQSWTRSDGYRQHASLDKKNIQLNYNWQYAKHSELKFTGFYTDLGYQTPGGLTAVQMEDNRRQSRPKAGPNPSAAEQKAAIYDKTVFGGLSNQTNISSKLILFANVFGSTNQIKNPFITNYEKRDEKNLGTRLYLSYVDRLSKQLKYEFQFGLEAQKGWYDIDNYDNNQGNIGKPQAKDKLENSQQSFFARTQLAWLERLQVELSMGLNGNKISYQQHYPATQENKAHINFGNAWMPRAAVSYLATASFALRASISKGFSAPTIAEVRSSDNIINKDLKPETGTNHEFGVRWHLWNRRIILDASAYTYQMNNAIIRQVRETGAEYFQNAGKIDQKGIEASILTYLITPRSWGLVRSLQVGSNFSLNNYAFKNYKVGDKDYSGNKLTAVPKTVWVNTLNVLFPYQLRLDLLSNLTAAIPLDDANTVYANRYHLLQGKISWGKAIGHGHKLNIFVGADNLLNQKYSLGNDINAFGGRYFNPAPLRNYYGGMNFNF